MAKLTVRNRNKGKVDKEGRAKKPNWEYRFEMAPVGGKRKQASKSGFATQREAEQAGAAALAEYLDAGRLHVPTEMSVADFLDEWLEQYVRPNLRRNTVDDYESMIRIHVKPALGHYRLKSLSPSTCQTWANSLKDKDLARRYMQQIMASLRNALDYAVQPMGYIKDNPMLYVRAPKNVRPPKKRVVIQSDDWKRIIDKFPFTHRYHMPLMIGYHTGLRVSEVFALTWADIDLEAGTLTVNKQLVSERTNPHQPVEWRFAQPKTYASERTIKLGSTILETLRRERLRQRQNKLAYGEYYKRFRLVERENGNEQAILPSDNGMLEMVCVDVDGSMVTPNSFRYASRIIRTELGIKFEFHALRHTHATMLAENGVNPKNLQQRLGHNDIRTTLQIYVHDTEKMADETVEIFERVLAHTK